ncbi:hypothetical protein [Microbaculum sp. FT89]|uniref:hypothetical protein n=1 Tax=Microbaculum sp. FT89 TaxID=3447298 RepID=UPI003F537673
MTPMTQRARAVLLTAVGFVAAFAAVATPAMACPEGETRFRNGVQYTCTCYTGGNGKKTCLWQPD